MRPASASIGSRTKVSNTHSDDRSQAGDSVVVKSSLAVAAAGYNAMRAALKLSARRQTFHNDGRHGALAVQVVR